jgi:hypothetical protein
VIRILHIVNKGILEEGRWNEAFIKKTS